VEGVVSANSGSLLTMCVLLKLLAIVVKSCAFTGRLAKSPESR
jgi:hypothetical protein